MLVIKHIFPFADQFWQRHLVRLPDDTDRHDALASFEASGHPFGPFGDDIIDADLMRLDRRIGPRPGNRPADLAFFNGQRVKRGRVDDTI